MPHRAPGSIWVSPLEGIPVIEVRTSPTTTTIVISGALDLGERGQFPEIASRVVGLRRSLLVIDMTDVTVMDSTGAAFLISLADSRRKRGGATVLRGCSERDLFVLDTCGALGLFRIVDTSDDVGADAPNTGTTAS